MPDETPKEDAQDSITALPVDESISQHLPKHARIKGRGRKYVLSIPAVVDALIQGHHTQNQASRILGVTAASIGKFMKKHCIDKFGNVNGKRFRPIKIAGRSLAQLRQDEHDATMRRAAERDISGKAMGMENQKDPPHTPDPKANATPPPPSNLVTEDISSICRYMLEKEVGLLAACRELGHKPTQVHLFLAKKGNEAIREEYYAIRAALVDMSVDKMDEVADDCTAINYNAQRVRLLAMQWKAQALRSDLYGGFKKDKDRIPPGSERSLTDEELDRKINQRLAALDAIEGRTPRTRTKAVTEAPASQISGLETEEGINDE